MPFSFATTATLEYLTTNPPVTEDCWYGPWISFLTHFFPDDDGYIVNPQQRIPNDDQSHFPDLVIEIVKLTSPPLVFRTVLIVKIKNTQHWPHGQAALDRQLGRQADAAFAGTATKRIYWIGAIGPRWRYGEKEDNGQSIVPLSEWHERIHGEASFESFTDLARLVRSL